jgi:hypothetical protein
MAVDLLDPELVEALQNGEVGDLATRETDVRGTENERVIALVAPTVQEGRRLGVGASDDDPRHAHDVELEAGRVQPLDLFVDWHQDLARLMAALLHARLLILDVIAGNPGLDEATDQVADVGIAAVTGVGIRDEKWAVVDLGSPVEFRLGHPQSGKMLVAIGGEQSTNDRSRLVGHLAQRVACQIRARVLLKRSLGRGGPAAQIDPLDSHPLHHDGLTGRVGTEGRDRATLGEQLPQEIVELLRGDPRYRVVLRNRAPLLGHLSRRVQTRDALESGAVEPRGQIIDSALEIFHCPLQHSSGHQLESMASVADIWIS